MPQAVARQLPPRLLPILYFGFAHLSLALAFAAVAIDPYGVSGFFYHVRMLAVVHLVTLGWITASILGSLYLVGPIALRVTFRAGWMDYAAFAFVTVGVSGMVAHFWIAEYGGMAWSASMAALGILGVGARVLGGLVRSPVSRAVIGHIALAFMNIAGAATMGILIGFDKIYHFLPGYILTNVFAHAHLAAVGWASMMVVGVAYRLLPMILPAEMPAGPKLWATAVVLQTGVAGLFVTLVLRNRWTGVFAVTIVAGFLVFLGHAIWMARRPRPRPPAIVTPDPAELHAAAALVSLALASALGLRLALGRPSGGSLRIAMAYGVFGLVGFLAQMVVAMEGRLLPLFAWYWAFARSGSRGPVPSPHQMPWRAGQYIVFALWVFGVPALAAGLAFDAAPWVRAAGWCLLAATVLDTAQIAQILAHAYRRPGVG
jgi:hypothetical protein